ncbi:MAG: bifunctional YncE family protein/alkaline phosphatase family protein [Fimbriimonas sp.]|nr:bifunctional YncE family protein/alkaline phosphatase family protein [Fimbriimonas sp.]
MKKLVYVVSGCGLFVGIGFASWVALRAPQVGKPTDRGTMVATGQFVKSAGRIVTFNSRPVDVAVSPDGSYAYLKDNTGIEVVDVRAMTVLKTVKVDGSDSFCGIALTDDGKTLCYTTATDKIAVFDVAGSDLTLRRTITLPAARVGGAPDPCGIVYQDPTHAFVCLNRDNSVALVDLESGALEKWDTDVAPFGIGYDIRTQRLYVSCWSRKAEGKEPQAASSGTNVPVDDRGVGLGGRLDVFDLRRHLIVESIPIGHHASEVEIDGDKVYIPCSGSDTVEVVSIGDRTRKTIKLFPNQPVGAAPSSIAFAPDDSHAYVACSGRNSVVVLNLKTGRTEGEYPTAWYPAAVRFKGGKLYVACTKGIGERAPEKNPISHNSWDLTGSLCEIGLSVQSQPLDYVPAPSARRGIAPVPLPDRPGEPSLFKHVVYIIRENRSYDQVFGDVKEGDGEPSLCTFGEAITPNAHALAHEFTLLDNYYCNGICSADGHSWATEGNTTANLERSVSAWPRSYPFGDDALNTSSTGFLWDSAISSGKSFLNFGEFDYASTANKETYFDCLKEHYAGTHNIKFKQNIGVARMVKYAAPGYPGWDLSIPDVLRADIFLQALKGMEGSGKMPDLTILYLCCDHTGGPVTARAQVADNDLATGMCIEGITKSKFWKDTCVFVEEDDPQAGWDHVDGHRSPCLVVSPYSRGIGRVSDFYNQTSVVRSIEDILGLKSKSYFVSISPLMFGCFGPKLDLTPFTARPNKIPLDETKVKNYGRNFDLSKPDRIDDKKFNRAIWAETMPGKPYPAEWEGAHGRGLAARGLTKVDVDR